ncbi:MAG: c-type cytochrome [Thermaurantiacus sp.]
MTKRVDLLRAAAGCAALALLAACGGAEQAGAPATDTTAAAPATPEAPPAVAQDAAFADLTGDAERGAAVFRTHCAACHVLEEGVNRVGPSLYQKIGATAGQVEGFRYSKANAESGIVWTEEQMFTYLANPQAVIPGTIMAFAGLPDPQERADVIAYMVAETGRKS